MKTLTVFTPAYNRAHTIGRTYESLCRQSCKDFEWLVIDDGSSDNTRELVEGWIAEGKILIRYMSSDGQLRIASFGDYFFYGQELYVFDYDDMWASEHNEGVVIDYFHDECKGRGYAHKVTFAGVWTGIRDSNGKIIYTGDVCKIVRGASHYRFAISSFGADGSNACYAFVLDNHKLTVFECDSATIDGNLFETEQDLNWPRPLISRCVEFNKNSSYANSNNQ